MGLTFIIRLLCSIPVMVPICGKLLATCGVRSWQVDTGVWVMRFESFLPSNIILQIVALQPPSPAKGTYLTFWAHSKSGRSTTHSAYLAISEDNSMHNNRLWRMVWRWKGPQSVRIFLWQVFHDWVKTKAELVHRHIPILISCDRCGAVTEDAIHALRDCPLVKRFWLLIIPDRK